MFQISKFYTLAQSAVIIAAATLVTACGDGLSGKVKPIDYPTSFGVYNIDSKGEVKTLKNQTAIEDKKNYGKPTVSELGTRSASQALRDPRFGKDHIVKDYVFDSNNATNLSNMPNLIFLVVNSDRPTLKFYPLSNNSDDSLLWKTVDSWKRSPEYQGKINDENIEISSPSEGVFQYKMSESITGCAVVEVKDVQGIKAYPFCLN